MGCNTSQEQKSAVAESNGDIETNNGTNQTPQNSAKSGRNVKSAKSDTLKNGQDNPPNDDQKSEEEAATRIQAVFRRHKVRASMKQGDSSAKSNNTNSGSTATATSNASSDPTKAELEAEFREDDKELCDAATRIQAAFRGHLARKEAGVDELKDDLQEITKKVAEELDIDLNDPELHRAATKIQASFRELCDAATRIQAAFRGHLARKEAGVDELKDDLQEITKKVAEELDIDLNDPELHRAATKIQASFRGHKVRKDTTS